MYQNNQAYKTPHREREPIKLDTHCVYGGHPHIFQRSCYFTYLVICCNFFPLFCLDSASPLFQESSAPCCQPTHWYVTVVNAS